MKAHYCFAFTVLLLSSRAYAQMDSSLNRVVQFPNHLFSKLNRKLSSLDVALDRQTDKYLRRMARREKKMQDKLFKIDSNAAKNLFAGTQEKYSSFQRNTSTTNRQMPGVKLSGEYLPYVDSIKTSLDFAQKYPDYFSSSYKPTAGLNSSVGQFNSLQQNFANAEKAKEYIRRRKELLKEKLMQYSGLSKYLNDYNKQVYYYSAQVKEYKEALNDPDKMLQKALVILNKIPAFTQFIKQNGQLAGLFGIAGNYGSADGVIGLQTRDQVQQLLQGTISGGGGGGLAALQSNLESAHQQLDQFKDKLSSLGSGSADIDMPNFKPNNQKTKSFLKRIELGTNIQTTRANGYFPSTTNIGLSVGYKISNKAIAGIGGSYNMGWGTSIQHIRFTSQGVSIRLFVDLQIKKNIYISGGFEENYVTPFTSFTQLATTTMWQKSGLIGLSKQVSLPGKLVKKTKVSLLWNFLSYYEKPRTQAILFRVGYNF